jgi:4'-phosphopantetheinyl transferase
MEPLPQHAVHVWYTLTPQELDHDLIARFRILLTPEERARHDRFVQEKDRRQYLVGKVLVRTILSRYLPRVPHEWIFTTNRFGKPVVANGAPESNLQFNLSHTEGLVACVVARDREVGIDVENVGRSVNLDVARRFFAPAEVAFLEQLPDDQRQASFFLFWTLKEAYVKARGLGLSLPLEQFAFRLEDLQAPTITFEPVMKEDPADWRFFLPAVPSRAHQVAVAVQHQGQGALEVELRPMPLSLFPAHQE